MTVSEIYTNGIQKQNRSHFANIVKIAKADNKVTIEEQILLEKMAKVLNVNMLNYSKILENPYTYPINPPVNHHDRIVRLYALAKMVLADGDVAVEEVKMMRKIAVGLGFLPNNADIICKKAIELLAQNTDLDMFIKIIKAINIQKTK